MNADLVSYYRRRAGEYEKIYAKPERQEDLIMIEKLLQDIFRGKDVLEIACGTGYWTQRIAKAARTILATDGNDTVIDIARSKEYFPACVKFQITDFFQLP